MKHVLVGLVFFLSNIASATLYKVEIFEEVTSVPKYSIWRESENHLILKAGGNSFASMHPYEIGIFIVGYKKLLDEIKDIEKQKAAAQKDVDLWKSYLTDKLKIKKDLLAQIDPLREEIKNEKDPDRLARLKELLNTKLKPLDEVCLKIEEIQVKITELMEKRYPVQTTDLQGVTEEFEDKLSKSPARVYPGDPEHAYFMKTMDAIARQKGRGSWTHTPKFSESNYRLKAVTTRYKTWYQWERDGRKPGPTGDVPPATPGDIVTVLSVGFDAEHAFRLSRFFETGAPNGSSSERLEKGVKYTQRTFYEIYSNQISDVPCEFTLPK